MHERGRTSAAAVAAGLLAFVGVAGLAGCSDAPGALPAPTPTASPPEADVPEVVPGEPGEPTTTQSPGESVTDDLAAHADIAFMQMMVLHHRQALDMAALVPDRAEDSRVVDVAERIDAAQAPEILVMAQWLTEQGVDVPPPNADPAAYDHSGHGHSGMEGLLTPDQMDELEDASGAEFDELFLEDMISHHRGAIVMALDVLRQGADQRVNELANDINAGQSAEIGRLEALLSSLS